MRDDVNVLRQKIETLDGSRQLSKRGQAAVRLDDLAELLRMPDTLKSVKSVGSVSLAEYNALVEDVAMIHGRLLALVNALRVRRGR